MRVFGKAGHNRTAALPRLPWQAGGHYEDEQHQANSIVLWHQSSLDQPIKPGCGQQPTNMQRRVLIGGAVAALLSSPRQAMAEAKAVPNDPFIVLLKGVYRSVPVSQGPKNNLGLSVSTVNLNDGSYSKTQIFPVWMGIPNSENQDKAIGNFYVQLSASTNLCAYDLPSGAMAMSFNSPPAGHPRVITVSCLTQTGRVGISWKEPSN
jgi:hypothetical protein